MVVLAETSPFNLSDEQVEAFDRDGVICLRGLYSPRWVQLLADALDEICSSPSPMGMGGDGGMRADAYTWQMFDKVRDFILKGPSAHIIQQAFRSSRVNFFYDQIFVKAEGSGVPTPWHQDSTFWPMTGYQIASLWTSVDPVTPETSSLEFLGGSHRWGKQFQAVGVGGGVLPATRDFPAIPDVEADRSAFDILSWNLEPGDALLFHGATVHSARGNASKVTKRRAITTRWCGDDVRFTPGNGAMPPPWDAGLEEGAPLSGSLFPQLLPETDIAALAERLEHPIPPDMDRVMAAIRTAQSAL